MCNRFVRTTPIDRFAELFQALRPYPAERMHLHPVTTAVNNPRHEGPELILEDAL